MSRKLKVDFHVHTGEDPKDGYIKYSAKELLAKAADYRFDAITIAHHGEVYFHEELRRYAEELGILLIPGVEACVEGKHVLLINCRQGQSYRRGLKLATLREFAGEESLIIAPHPFYPKSYCLHEKLEQHIQLFDAIEYSHLHFRLLNFNKKAVAIAEHYRLPLVGTSDAHHLSRFNTTYSLIEAEKSIPAILHAVREGQVEVVTQSLSHQVFFKQSGAFLFGALKRLFKPPPRDDECA